METLTTGRVAHLSGVNRETVRFYERKGLIDEPVRNESGYRLYTPDVVKRITFIKNAQDMGFTLREIHELLNLRVENHSQCDEVRERTEKKIKQVENKINNLKMIKKALGKLVNTCSLNQSTGDCPILDAFYQES